MQKGFRLKFHTRPPLRKSPPAHLDPSISASIHLEEVIPALLQQNTIREVQAPFPKMFYSRIFFCPKKDGSVRPIIDLSDLNKLLVIPKFKMEHVRTIKRGLCTPLWGCTADIEKAFHNVPIWYKHQKYLAFSIGKYNKRRVFVWQFLPFGLSLAPWAFHRIVKPIKVHLRDLMFQVVSYLDDFAFFATSKAELYEASQEFKQILKRLNLSINWEKSDFTPRRSLIYLGVKFDLKNLSLSLPEEKIRSVQSACDKLIARQTCSRRNLESLLGRLSFAATYVHLGRLRLLPLIRWLNLHTSLQRDHLIPLDNVVKSLIRVWTSRSFLSTPVPMHLPHPTVELMTDASKEGWCGVLLPQRVRKLWPDYHYSTHINWLELKAVHLSLRHFQHMLRGQTVCLWTDNTTALSCLRNQGSRTIALMLLTEDIYELCDSLNIKLVPRHLQGVLNVLADAGSRSHPISTEWMLDKSTFRRIAALPAIFPQVDLFATRDNNQLENFVSPCPDPNAVGRDALLLDWNRWQSIYLFPPHQVLQACFIRLEEFEGAGVLVTDVLHSAADLSVLRRRCRYSIPLTRAALSQVTDNGVMFASPHSFRLRAWIL